MTEDPALARLAAAAADHANGGRRVQTLELLALLRRVEPTLAPHDEPDRLDQLMAAGAGVHWEPARTATTMVGTRRLPKFVDLALAEPDRDRRRPVDTMLRDELEWARSLPLNANQRRLVEAVNRWLRNHGPDAPWVTTRERAYQLLQNEKAFDPDPPVGGMTLWRPDRLTFELLRCHPVRVPLTWEPVDPAGGPDHGPLLIVENSSTYHSALAALRGHGPSPGRYVAVAFTIGNQAVSRLHDIADLPVRPTVVRYLGDLDLGGLEIAARACAACEDQGVPAGPADALWRMLLGQEPTAASSGVAPPERSQHAAGWLPDGLAEPAARLLASGMRIPQEALRADMLHADPSWTTPI